MTPELAADARARLDAHLDAVEQTLLAASRPREQRRAIVDDLETQILDMLAKRSQNPTLTDVEAILTQLDPPAAYGDAPHSSVTARTAAPASLPVPPAAPASPRFSRTAIGGFICILLSLLPLAMVAIFALYMASANNGSKARDIAASLPRIEVPLESPATTPFIEATTIPAYTSTPTLHFNFLPCLLVPFVPLGLVGTVLGWVAFGQIRKSNGLIQGKGLALFDGLFYPILSLILILFIA